MAFGLGEGSSWVVLFVAYTLLCLGLAFLFTPLFSTSLGSLPPQAVLVRQRDRRDSAAGGRCRRHRRSSWRSTRRDLLRLATSTRSSPSAAEAANGSHLAFLAGGIISLAVILVSVFITRPPVAEGHGGEWLPKPQSTRTPKAREAQPAPLGQRGEPDSTRR